eukprot:TRINITY_DN29150_c0_g1_i1.p1 TRINITY_DN29150_c0_g1~~TRINITY_DN29150_c0_g1_i1.p1  ORF type:complete len:500 (-),score=91.21 TRINITY_DN29150_c0_g1_i1:275-1774(-)
MRTRSLGPERVILAQEELLEMGNACGEPVSRGRPCGGDGYQPAGHRRSRSNICKVATDIILPEASEWCAAVETVEVDNASDAVTSLGELLQDRALVRRAQLALVPHHFQLLYDLAEQSIHRGIDYATLGLGWHHPRSRLAYRHAQGQSFEHPASRKRQEMSRQHLVELTRQLVHSASQMQAFQCERLLVDAFCREIGLAADSAYGRSLASTATFPAVAAALEAELLLPLRAFREGIEDMATTYEGHPVPRGPLEETVDAILRNVLTGTFATWRYTCPRGRAQLAGLSNEQMDAWREPSISYPGPSLVIHEDTSNELGFFWATKIGGPSHGFDYEGQCLLPLLCNARHKVILVSDRVAWPHHPCGRAHFRLLWTAPSSNKPSRPLLWLEALNCDFVAKEAGISMQGWQLAVLAHAASKAQRMGVPLSIDVRLVDWLRSMDLPGKVVETCDSLLLRPSNGVLEASDYLTQKHDWVQMEDEITAPLHRAIYEPEPNLRRHTT